MILGNIALDLAILAYKLNASIYLVVERQYAEDLAVRYPNRSVARAALTDSLFIDGLAEEDALDIFLSRASRGAQVILPPNDIPMWKV